MNTLEHQRRVWNKLSIPKSNQHSDSSFENLFVFNSKNRELFKNTHEFNYNQWTNAKLSHINL